METISENTLTYNQYIDRREKIYQDCPIEKTDPSLVVSRFSQFSKDPAYKMAFLLSGKGKLTKSSEKKLLNIGKQIEDIGGNLKFINESKGAWH